jgi:hypothetical protein
VVAVSLGNDNGVVLKNYLDWLDDGKS